MKTTESTPFKCALNILSGTGSPFFFCNLYLCFFCLFVLVNVRDDVECEIFMMFPFMSTHSNTFIIWQSRDSVLLFSLLCQQAFVIKLPTFLGSKELEVLEYS